MEAYVAMGCRATWTCAPYQLPERPAFGEQIAWAESNAIVFANSVLGARTNRYGDFIDVCCAITGRAPFAGPAHRRGTARDRGRSRWKGCPSARIVAKRARRRVGHVVGPAHRDGGAGDRRAPAGTPEDHLRAVGAAAASSGAVAMFHAVGVTPEAPTLDVATGGAPPARSEAITTADLRAARDELEHGRPGRADRRRQRRHAASVARRARSARGAHGGRQAEHPAVRERRPGHPREGRRPGADRRSRARRRDARLRHLHLHHARDPRDRGPGHDRLGEVGLVRAREPGVRHRVRQHRGVRPERGGRRGRPRRGALGWTDLPAILAPGTAAG